MTLLTHLLVADLRRLRVVLALWVMVVVANRVVRGASALLATDANLRESSAVLSSMLWLAELLLSLLLVSLVIHAHPTVGTDAFWLTRPIPRRLLLAEKVILLVTALVVVAATAEALLLAVHGMPLEVSAGVVAQVASTDIIWALLVMVAAALTRNLARFAFLIGGVLVAVALAIAVTIAVLMARLSSRPSFANDTSDGDITGLVIFNAVLVIAALATLAVQYQTRRRSRSILVGVGGVALAFLVSWAWPIPFLAPRLIVPDWARDDRALTVRIDPSTISTRAHQMFLPERERQWSSVNGRIEVDGIAIGWTAAAAPLEAAVQLANGEVLRSAGGGQTNFVSRGDDFAEPYATARRLLDVSTLATLMPIAERNPEQYPALFLMERDELARYAPTTGDYRARMRITLTRHVIDGTLPLRPAASYQNGAYRLLIDSLSQMNGEVMIVTRETRAASMWERRPWAFQSFYLRNRSRREAVELSEYPLRGTFSLLRFLPIAGWSAGGQHEGNGFFSRAMALTYPPRYSTPATPRTLDAAWLGNAELVVMRRTEEGSVERMVSIAPFPIGNGRELAVSR